MRMDKNRIYDFDVKESLALQSQIEYLESQVKGLLKLLEQKHILSDHKILICAKCHNTLSPQTGSQENDGSQDTGYKGP